MASILYFLLLISVLIFVHEFGHYLFARLFKVKVQSFSIGFGPKAFSFKRGEEEWAVRWLPLGGYVQMLGADPSEQIPDDLKDVSFTHKPLWQRALIILAGPLFNLLLPLPIYFFVTLATHDQDLPPVVGQVLADAPADGVLEHGDEVVAINGDPIRYWHDLVETVSDAPGEPLTLSVQRGAQTVDVQLTPEPKTLEDPLGLTSREVGRIGVVPSLYAPIVGVLDPDTPAARAGLETFDEVLAVDGQPVASYLELERALATRVGQPTQLLILREHPVDAGGMGHVALQSPLTLTLTPEARDGVLHTGLRSAELFLAQVDPDSPAARAGLRRGDALVAVDGKPYNNFYSLMEDLRRGWQTPHALTVRRGAQTLTLSIQLERLTVIGELKEERPVITAGFYNYPRRVPPPLRTLTFGDRVAYAADASVSTTLEASGLIIIAVVQMARGELSRKSLGGPIMIGQIAGMAGEAGIEFFLQMMAYISINLGILNLMPIPILDGGHLMLFAIEGIQRKPLSARTRQIASFIGFVIVLFLMVFAFKNDLERYWDDIIAFFGG